MRNSYRTWTPEDLALLRNLIQNDVPMHHITQALGRTQRAIQLAFKNILFQQILQHPPTSVAEAYDLDMDDLTHSVVPAKYYQPLYPIHRSDESQPNTSSSWFSIFVTSLATASCLAYYGYLLHQNSTLALFQ